MSHFPLLALMSEADFAAVRGYLRPVDLPRGAVLGRPYQPVEEFCFVEEGLASQVTLTKDDRRHEVGVYGHEGGGPVSLLLGIETTPYEITMQLPGRGLMITSWALRTLMRDSLSFRSLLLTFLYTTTVQTAYTASSNSSALVGERLSRWLLMCHDRAEGNELALTHEFLGVMLGVRRAGVTHAVHLLEGAGMIRGSRGLITIRDREKLLAAAGETYGKPEAEYERVLGPMPRGRG